MEENLSPSESIPQGTEQDTGVKSIAIATEAVEHLDKYHTYHLTISRNDTCDSFIKESCDVINYTGLENFARSSFHEEFDTLVEKVNVAKSEGNTPVVIHCGAGRGRTGMVIAAAILRTAILGQHNDLFISAINYKEVICNLIVDLRNHGGGHTFLQSEEGLRVLFKYTLFLFNKKLDK